MLKHIALKLCSFLILFGFSVLVAAATPVGNWRLTTQTQVMVLPKSGLPAVSANRSGNEFATFNADSSYEGSNWIGRLSVYFNDQNGAYLMPLDLRGRWIYKSGRYTVTYDSISLGFQNKAGLSINEAFLQRAGLITLLVQALGYLPSVESIRVTRYLDRGQLSSNGRVIKGDQRTTLVMEWRDPKGTLVKADVTVSALYRGRKITSNSDCCGSEPTDGAKNLADSQSFLADNQKQAGVQTTASGLQYLVLQEGSGTHPQVSDTVTVNYRGFFPSGKLFDAGSLVTFGLDGVITGWTEGLQLMTPGAKYRFYIPSALAYGEQGQNDIGPNAALLFDVELIGIVH